MEVVKQHRFQLNDEAHRQVCICGKPFLDPSHTTTVKMIPIRGTAKPDTIKR